MTLLRSVRLACWTITATVVLAACTKGEDDTTPPPSVLSQQGESCERTADCAGGLACFGGSCQPADVNIAATNKECTLIQCDDPAECCEKDWQRSSSCASYDELCATDPTTYASYCEAAQGPECICDAARYTCEENVCVFNECNAPVDCCSVAWTRGASCASYETLCASDPTTYAYECEYAASSECVCDGSAFSCNENQCAAVCVDNTDCYYGTPICLVADGRCVECNLDGDCTDLDARCLANVCVSPECSTNSDCPAFYACQEAECVEVGCASDRECMVATDNYLAVCSHAEDPPNCVIRCARDAECDDASHPLWLCQDGICVDPGCDSDEECKIRLGGLVGLGYGYEAVCRAP